MEAHKVIPNPTVDEILETEKAVSFESNSAPSTSVATSEHGAHGLYGVD